MLNWNCPIQLISGLKAPHFSPLLVEAGMVVHRGNRRLFVLINRFVKRYGPWGFHASQEWSADQLGVSVRTIKRWIHELREEGAIDCKRRSQDTMLCTVLRDILAPQMAPQMAPHILINSPSESMNPSGSKYWPKKPSKTNYAEELRLLLEEFGVGWGREDFMGRVVELGVESGLAACIAASVFASLVRQRRFRAANEGYILNAYRSELGRVA